MQHGIDMWHRHICNRSMLPSFVQSRHTQQQTSGKATCLCRAHGAGVSGCRLIVMLPLLPIEPHPCWHIRDAQSVACLGLQSRSLDIRGVLQVKYQACGLILLVELTAAT